MKYSIFHDIEDDGYYVVNNSSKEYATEIKVYESDSLHDCFVWFKTKSWEEKKFDLKLNLELDEEVWCVYWGDFSENYYMCPDKGDGTLDDVCFRGSEEECDEWFNNHYIAE